MAEISKITLPNGDTYDIKDAAARENADHGNARIFSADCSTAETTQRKDVTIPECTELIAGDVFVITFTNAQTYNGAPKMQINSLGAKDIRLLTGHDAGRYEWGAGEVVVLKWTGTCFVITTGCHANTTYYGRTKLYTGANSGATSLALTPGSLYNMANRSICPYYSTSATYAVGDKVRYGDYIYECINEIPTAEAWTADHWQIAPTLQEQVTSINGNMSTKTVPLSNLTILTGTADGAFAGYKVLGLYNMRLVVRGVTISNGNALARIENLEFRPLTNVYLKVYDYDTGKPINGSLYLNKAGQLTYYGDRLSNKAIMIHDTFTVNDYLHTITVPSSSITARTGTIDGTVAGYKVLGLCNLRLVVNGVTISSGNALAQIGDSTFCPLTNVYLKVYDYDTGKPINGSLYLNKAGQLTYYGDQLSSKNIMIHDTFAVNS